MRKYIALIVIIALVAAGVAVGITYRAEAAGQQAPALATLGALDTEDWSDAYSMMSQVESGAECAMNASDVLRRGKIPGTELDLTADQKTQLATEVAACAARVKVARGAANTLLGVTDSQLDVIAQTRGYQPPQSSKDRRAAESATRTAIALTPTAVPKGAAVATAVGGGGGGGAP